MEVGVKKDVGTEDIFIFVLVKVHRFPEVSDG